MTRGSYFLLLLAATWLVLARGPAEIVLAQEPEPSDTPKASQAPPPIPTNVPASPVPTLVPPSTLTPPPPAPEATPTPAPPEAPPPTLPSSPPTAPPPTQRPGADDPPPAPIATQEAPVLPGQPTAVLRTPRPTRTPRGGTPTPTPPTAGALKLTMSAHPPAPGVGESFEVRLHVTNQSLLPLHHVTLEVRTTSDVNVSAADATLGVATLTDAGARWILGEIPASAGGRLIIDGMLTHVPAAAAEVCATVISFGAPVEYCLAVEAGFGAAQTAGANFLAASIPLPGGQAPHLFAEHPPGEIGRWLLIVGGLGLLGAWYGLSSRRTRAERS